MKMRMSRKLAIKHVRAQSTLEYILVLAAVLLALIAAAAGTIKTGTTSQLTQAGTVVTKAGAKVANNTQWGL